MYIYIYIYVYIYVCIYMCTYIYICIHVCIPSYTYIYTYTYLYIFVYICMFIYMYVYIYLYINTYIYSNILRIASSGTISWLRLLYRPLFIKKCLLLLCDMSRATAAASDCSVKDNHLATSLLSHVSFYGKTSLLTYKYVFF